MSDRDTAQTGIATLSDVHMLEQQRLIKQVKLEIPQVRQPTLVIHLREDDHASRRHLEYMQANLGGPITAVMLDSTYPTLTIDQQRELIIDRSLKFIAQLAKPSGSTLGRETNF